MLNEDYKEMLQLLLDNEVEFLVVGAYAMGAFGYPRATGDLDIWVNATSRNSERVYSVLQQFGAPLAQLDQHTFSGRGVVFQIGVAPRRVDIITDIEGVDFTEAYKSRQNIEIEGLNLPFISKADLIRNKRATGREKDRLDAEQLEKSPEI